MIATIWTLAVAFGLGGSGSRNDVALMAIELASLPLFVIGVWRIATAGTPRHAAFPLVLLVGLFCLPILQLIPLPPFVWSALPGRSEAIHTLALAGAGQEWRPLSLTPDATWRSLLWLVPPASLFMAALQLDKAERLYLAVAILVLLGLSLLIAGMQIAGAKDLHLDPLGNNDLPTGLFANRNHQADAMIIGLPISASVLTIWSRATTVSKSLARYLFVGLMGLWTTGALATLSRAGLILGGLGLIGSLTIFSRGSVARPADRRGTQLVMLGVAVSLIVVAQLGVGAVISRFDQNSESDARLQFWPTVVAAAGDFFPVGAGLGAFDPVYRSVEPPQSVSRTYLNAAHNDFLQIWLEVGAAGIALLVGFFIWFIAVAFEAWRVPPQMGGAMAQGASVAIAIMLLHSMADYPLRTPALACVFAILSAFILERD